MVFMTDGEPTVGDTNPDSILKRVKDAAKGAQIRIFSFGVGTDVNTKLLDMVAEQSRGYSQYVLPNERLEVSMSAFWGKVLDPVISNLKIETGDVHVANLYPNEMPDLFRGDQLVAFGTYSKPGKTAITLTGMVNGTAQKFSQDVTFEEKTDASKDWIAKLWATRRVGYLLDQIRQHGESKEVKDEVVDLARRFGVVTPYTAMLIIEDEKARGVPVAERSMREMEFDRASVNSADAFRRIGETTGTQGVANSINTNGYKTTTNLAQADDLAKQSAARTKLDSGDASLAKGPDAPSARPADSATVYYSGGGGGFGGMGGAGAAPGGFGNGSGGGGGGGGGRGGGGGGGRPIGRGGGGAPSGGAPGAERPNPVATTAPAVTRDELNLGTSSQNGWQTASADKDVTGYRNITNYSQQTRIVNNRSFFLNGNQWTDAQIQQMKPETKHVKITFGSSEYFDLLAKHPDSVQYFSLGNNLSVDDRRDDLRHRGGSTPIAAPEIRSGRYSGADALVGISITGCYPEQTTASAPLMTA